MNSSQTISATQDVAGVLNYVDYKLRFPVIKQLYDAISEYDEADLYFVPTNQPTISLTERYKQNDIATDWAGSWRHITDLYRSDGLRQTIIELANFYGNSLESGSIDKGDDKPLPEQSYWSNPQYKYGEFVANGLSWRLSFQTLTKETRQFLLDIKPWLYKSMTKYESLNAEEIKQIEESQIVSQLLSRTLSNLTGFELLQILKMTKE